MPVIEPNIAAKPEDLASALELIQKSRSRIDELETTNQLLRQKIDALLRRYFGNRKSDSIDPAQLELILSGMNVSQALETPVEDSQPKTPSKNKGQAKRRKLPEHLETERVVIEPQEVKTNPEAWKKVDEEVSEELDWVPSKLIRRLYIRPKYTPVKNPDQIVIAPMPPRVIDKGIAGPALLAHIIVSKYVDHLPLYRLERIFQNRFQVPVSRKSMADWVEVVANWLKPIYNYLKADLLSGDYLQIDETPIRYLNREFKGKSKKGYLWVFSQPGGTVLFEWNKSRGHQVPLEYLGDFSGMIQCDGFSGYVTLANKKPQIVLAGCWAHLYRKVRDAVEHHPIQASWALKQMQHLYAVEKELREAKATPKQRLKRREQESRPVIERLHRGLKLMEKRILKRKLLPKSTLGKATTYALGQWEALKQFLENGQVEIDNNLIENSIRPSAIGKKNFLFFGADKAGWRSAVIYSIVETCRRLDIEPLTYLTDVLQRIPSMTTSQIPQLVPAQWKQDRLES
ncbi:IS66 family transposase [bacterium]|nr:IS66 family transposase [bacterium]